ncbi:polyprenyl synthetase family protein [Streptomyces fructofermentans]|uniref:polyprenyl synthetase family protein n=1 Tax=Streptomyces fructofermentans TaxID=152141 RepID=UPI0033F507BE
MRPSEATDHPAGEPPPGVHHSPARARAADRPPGADPGDPRAIDADVAGAVGRVLDRLLAERVATARGLDPGFARDLAERVARFTLDGGRRSRSRFVWWALRACGGADAARADAALHLGAALELIQTCALVHDDVMDGSRLRRGRPSLHADIAAQYGGAAPDPRTARFGESAGILAGDLALAWADDMVTDTCVDRLDADTSRRVREIWRAMRTEMVAGQYLDVRGRLAPAPSPAHAMRAACLKSALYSVERPLALGAALARADAATTRELCAAGRCAGIAFQLRDDLQDVFGDPRRTGKPGGGDIRAGKPTYLVAVAEARAEGAGDRTAATVLRRSLGRADLSERDQAEVRDVLVGTGARAAVEARIDTLVLRGTRHLDSASLAPEGRDALLALLRTVAGAPPVPRPADGPPPGSGDGAPVPLLLSVVSEGAAQ